MDCHSAIFLVGNVQKLFHDVIRWCRTVNEIEVGMLYIISDEFVFVVFSLVKSDHSRHIEMLEYLEPQARLFIDRETMLIKLANEKKRCNLPTFLVCVLAILSP